jgi:hypothetical protein
VSRHKTLGLIILGAGGTLGFVVRGPSEAVHGERIASK